MNIDERASSVAPEKRLISFLLLMLAPFVSHAASYQVVVQNLNTNSGLAADGPTNPGYLYCSAEQPGSQFAVVDILIENAASGQVVATYPNVQFNRFFVGVIAFTVDDNIDIQALITERQDEVGFGISDAGCDLNVRVEAPLKLFGSLAILDSAAGEFRGISNAFDRGPGFSGAVSDQAGLTIVVPSVARIYDAACESSADCDGQKLAADGTGGASVTAAGAATSVGLVARRGVAADGASSLIIKFPTTHQLNISSIAAPTGAPTPTTAAACPYGSLQEVGSTAQHCTSMSTVGGPSDSKMVLVYTAPLDFPDVATLSKSGQSTVDPAGEIRHVGFDVYATTSPQDTYAQVWSVYLDMVRPPVLLVHGLWSGSGAWNDFMVNAYTDRNYDLTNRISYTDYSWDRAASDTFRASSRPASVLQVESDIKYAKDSLRSLGIAVSSVDAVAHSMGGLQLRSLAAGGGSHAFSRSDNFFRGDIHKIVTIGTPHDGSPIARNLMKNRCFQSDSPDSQYFGFDLGNGGVILTTHQYGPTLQQTINNLLPYGIMFGPALEDLQPGSAALTELGSTHIPTHFVAGKGSFLPGIFQLVDSFALFNNGANLDLAHAITGANDGVVSIGSATAGLSVDGAAISVFEGLNHLDLTDDAGAYAIIDSVLRAPIFPGAGASQYVVEVPPALGDGGALYDFLHCPVLTASAPNSRVHIAATTAAAAFGSTIEITPTPGTVVPAGQALNISLKFSGATAVKLFVAEQFISTALVADSFGGTVQVPNGSLGRLPIRALVTDGKGRVATVNSYVTIDASISGAIVTIRPTTISLISLGQSSSIIALATLPDKSVVHFDGSVSGVSFQLTSQESTPIVALVNGTTVVALRKGLGALVIAAAGSTISIPIEVQSNSFQVAADAGPSPLFGNIPDPRSVQMTFTLPGDLKMVDIDVTSLKVLANGTEVPFTQSTASTDTKLVFQIAASQLTQNASAGASTVVANGLTTDGSPWTATSQLAVATNGAVVPNLNGMLQAAATSTLGTNGLTLGAVTSQVDAAAPGTVLSQNPAAGTVVVIGTSVTAVIAAAAPTAQVANSGGGGGALHFFEIWMLIGFSFCRFCFARLKHLNQECSEFR
jgi:pimeloyl-ACP methyl ester carboxylesterase